VSRLEPTLEPERLVRRSALLLARSAVAADRSPPALTARETVADQPENQARRGNRLCADPPAGPCLFLEDGRVEIDNNAVERAIRPLALGRKTRSLPARTAVPSTGR